MIGAHELHSSIGTLFFCYGIVGTILFAIFVWIVLRGSALRIWLIVGAGFAYGMTHQGLRFILLWIMLGMVIALRDRDQQQRQQQRAARQRVAKAV